MFNLRIEVAYDDDDAPDGTSLPACFCSIGDIYTKDDMLVWADIPQFSWQKCMAPAIARLLTFYHLYETSTKIAAMLKPTNRPHFTGAEFDYEHSQEIGGETVAYVSATIPVGFGNVKLKSASCQLALRDGSAGPMIANTALKYFREIENYFRDAEPAMRATITPLSGGFKAVHEKTPIPNFLCAYIKD